MRVCHPGPVAFHRASASGGRRRDINVRALPVFGRPRGLSILADVAAPNKSGRTSRALRARAKVSVVQTGLSRSARSGLRLRFISFHLAFVGLPKADDMHLALPRCEHQHMQSPFDQTQRLVPAFAIDFAQILDDQRAVPFKHCREIERNPAQRDISLALRHVERDVHIIIVYTYIQECKLIIRRRSLPCRP